MLCGTVEQSMILVMLYMTTTTTMMMISLAAPATDDGYRRSTRQQRRTQQLRQSLHIADTNRTTLSSYANVTGSSDGGDAVDQRPKRQLIRGSKKAFTITKREYLQADWCKTEPFQQIVHKDGCLRKRILNRFCYGQCNSFFIPKSQPDRSGFDRDDHEFDLHRDLDLNDDPLSPDPAQFRSCAACAPKRTDWTTVVLRCPGLIPPFRRRRVRIVRHCKCLAVRAGR